MSDLKPVFRQVESTDLYLSDDNGQADAQVFQAAYLAPAGSALGSNLSVEEAWSNAEGVYLFLPHAPADVDLFIQKVRALVQEPGFVHTRFLWIPAPEFTSSPWVQNKLRAVPPTTSGDSLWSVMQTETFNFADYQFVVGAQCSVSGPDESNGYGFTITPASGVTNISLRSPLATYPIHGASVMISLNDETAGCFKTGFLLSQANGENSDFTQLQVGCAYFVPDPDDESGSAVRTLFFPVLEQPSQTALTLYAALDPLNPLLSGRTFFSLFDAAGTVTSLPAMSSYFVTATGHDIQLTPQRSGDNSPNAGFAFCKRPFSMDPSTAPLYYLAPCGPFLITTDTSSAALRDSLLVPAERLVCGLSSVEYAGLMAESGNVLCFSPGKEAYAPGSNEESHGDVSPLLTDLGTTSWVSLTPPSGGSIYYYAQPEQAVLYNASSVSSGDTGSGHLDFLEVPAAELPSGTNQGAAALFPMVPFRGVSPRDSLLCRQVEQQAISPSRRAAIQNVTALNSGNSVSSGQGNAVGVTPQGLIVEIDENGMDWKRLVLGNLQQNSGMQESLGITIDSNWLQLSDVTGPFRDAMQSSELFLVAADPAVFLSACSVRYRLTQSALVALGSMSADERGPDSAFQTIRQNTIQAGFPIYDDLTAYQTQLTAWAPAVADYLDAWKKEGAYFELFISGWKFLLSPYQWVNLNRAVHQNTILILKFNHRALDELIDETGAWPWPDVAKINGSLQNTKNELRGIFDAAKTAVTDATEANSTSLYDNFVKNVILNPDWNGVLFLSCTVPLDQLPQQLEGVAAGIDTSRFYAHHLGLNITPLSVEQQQVELSATSLFGLIDYQDTDDLTYSPDLEFDFKTLTLQILFENSCIQSFSCRIELLICRLFGCQALLKDGVHGNNVILDGVCQTDNNGQNFYTFRQVGMNRYALEDSALETVEVLSSRFVTLVSENVQEEQSGITRSRFTLGGNLLFLELDQFDVFSFGAAEVDPAEGAVNGYLHFSEFIVDMSFSADHPEDKTFAVRTSGMSFDLTQSLCRTNGLYQKFPLSLTGLVNSPVTGTQDDIPQGVSPQEMGYTAIGAPVQQQVLTYPWYGLAMDLDLGTLGALAGSVGLKITLLAAWSVSEPMSDKKIFLGMKFPGLGDLGVKLPIEGILSLGFRNIQFLSSKTDKGRAYMLRLRQFGIRLLGLSFPPGNNDIYLFGNPDNTSNTKLGWYAAYSDGKDDDDSQVQSRRMLSGRRNRRGGEGVCRTL
ncbi:MAG TPA: hypothetical protein VLM37_05575 [Fibrobacteraceae bacterium]|nr:hypothetical protein [Fibrobacteraceae bacterium]